MSTKKSNKWPELGVITKNEVKDKNGKVQLDENGKPLTRTGFKLSDEIYEVLCKAGYNISQYGVLKTPIEELDGLIKAGFVDDSQLEAKKQTAKETHKWLKYKVQLPPPRSQS